MSATDVTPRQTAYASLIALEHAELMLMRGKGHSRIYQAIRTVDAVVAYLSNRTQDARTRLLVSLDDIRRVEDTASKLDQLDPESLVGRSLWLGIYLAQTALIGDSNGPAALEQARLISVLADQIGTTT